MTLLPPATRSVLVISHGFQPAYERGFCNGLVSVGHRVTLVTGARCDRLGLKPQIEVLALRGSQDEGRSAWAKMLNMARYHLALLAQVSGRRHDVVHVASSATSFSAAPMDADIGVNIAKHTRNAIRIVSSPFRSVSNHQIHHALQ